MYDFEKGRIKFIHGGRYPHCHSIFIDDDKRTIIDAASIEETLLVIHKERPIDILINSHGHEDHLLYNYLFPEAEFWAHKEDAHTFEDVKNMVECYGELSQQNWQGWVDFLTDSCNYVPRKANRFLQDGEVIQFGEVRMEVIHTPGHSPGHCAFYFIEEKVLFMGDLDLVRAGPFYGDLHSSIEDTINSLNRLRTYQCDAYLTSHGKGIHDGDPMYIDRYLSCIDQREDAIVELLSKAPRTIEEITDKGIIYGPKREVGGMWDLSLSERAMMEKHLESLKKKGLVYQEGKYFKLSA